MLIGFLPALGSLTAAGIALLLLRGGNRHARDRRPPSWATRLAALSLLVLALILRIQLHGPRLGLPIFLVGLSLSGLVIVIGSGLVAARRGRIGRAAGEP